MNFQNALVGPVQTIARRPLSVLICAAAGAIIGCLAGWVSQHNESRSVTTSIVFSYPAFERGAYPDGSQFNPDDIRRIPLLIEVLGGPGKATNEAAQALRNRISIEGMVAPAILAERDRIRTAGQIPPDYVPDRYRVSLVATGESDAPTQDRQLLTKILEGYRDSFVRTYTSLPSGLGSLFEKLKTADYPEYEPIFRTEIAGLTAFLQNLAREAGPFRSSKQVGFSDLIERVNFLDQIHVTETAGLLRAFGATKDRDLAVLKMTYQLSQLDLREQQALDEQKLATELLAETERRLNRTASAASVSQASTQDGSRIVDQGLIDSLLANDPYGFLVRRNAEARLQTKEIQAEILRLKNLRDNLTSTASTAGRNAGEQAQIEASLASLKSAYDSMITSLRETYTEYSRDRYSDAVRISDLVTSTNPLNPILTATCFGGLIGISLGLGIVLLSPTARKAG